MVRVNAVEKQVRDKLPRYVPCTFAAKLVNPGMRWILCSMDCSSYLAQLLGNVVFGLAMWMADTWFISAVAPTLLIDNREKSEQLVSYKQLLSNVAA